VKHLDIHVRGKVQGVWFRAATQEEAARLGINGFVQNESDGSIYLEAEGSQEQLADLLVWLQQGPPRAEVDDITSNESGLKNFSGFEIRR